MGNFINRIIRAAKLDAHLYEEVEADKSAMRQAMLVVVFSGVAAGLGNISKGGLSGVLLGTIIALAGWYIWAFLIYLIGTKLLPEPQTRSDIGELLRTIGFSSSPGLIRVLGIIPGLEGGVFFMVASIWMLVAMVIAVRQALDYTGTMRAVAVCVIGWIVQVLFIMILFYLFTGLPTPT
ncbi:MAG: YIP1 family protein [Candidatus Scalindua sediminis]